MCNVVCVSSDEKLKYEKLKLCGRVLMHSVMNDAENFWYERDCWAQRWTATAKIHSFMFSVVVFSYFQ